MDHKSASWNRNVVSWSADRWQWVSIGSIAGAFSRTAMLQWMISHNRHCGGRHPLQFPFLLVSELFVGFTVISISIQDKIVSQQLNVVCASFKTSEIDLQHFQRVAFSNKQQRAEVTLNLKEIGFSSSVHGYEVSRTPMAVIINHSQCCQAELGSYLIT